MITPPRPAAPRPAAPPPPAPRPVRPTLVSPAERADQILAELEGLKAQMAAMVHRVGTLLAELSDPKLIAAKGFERWEDLLQSAGLPAKPTALKYVALAEHFTEQDARTLGVEKGYALVRYAREGTWIACEALLIL